ncbi:hypothetical protein NM208_g6896 [Fusarium decemcellulare]|uniref:Uncharacterized protein n=1 Tax=Fusarium decemcellulare TaxID=57161 RepID=A0ACC1SBE6_9HYPO|nr:hypothetical protein NM208_g6896 [Fusarium decemcellulare]
MLPGIGSRLGVIADFLALVTLIFALELLILVRGFKSRPRYIALRQWYAPISAAVLGIVLVPIMFAGIYTKTEIANSTCTAALDADVAGDGVRIGAWVQIGTLIVISLIGSFHPEATGAKEIGAGLVLTHISLAISLLVQVERDTLGVADAAIGSMILDAQNMALSIQLVSKETLAARWQVRTVIIVQIYGLVILALLVTRLFGDSFVTTDCRCLKAFWWAWLGNCSPSTNEQALFWILYALRCVTFLQACFHSMYNAPRFHLAEPKCGDEGDEYQKRGGLLLGITYPYSSDNGPAAFYSEYPATVAFIYALYGIFSLTSMGAAEIAMHDLDLKLSSGISSVGQIIAIVIAIVTFFRAVYLFGRMFRDAWDSTGAGFVSPFHWYKFPASGRRTYTLAPMPPLLADIIEPGHVFKDPPGPDFNPLDRPAPIPSSSLWHSENHGVRMRFSQSSSGIASIFQLLCCHPFASYVTSESDMEIQTERLETFYLQPGPDYIKDSMRQPMVRDYLDRLGQNRVKRFYMVTGVKVANGYKISNVEREFEEFLREPDVSHESAPVQTEWAHDSQRVVLAYQLVAITIGADGEVVEVERFINGRSLP